MKKNITTLFALATMTLASCSSTSLPGENYQVKNKPKLQTGQLSAKPAGKVSVELPLPEWGDKAPEHYQLQAALLNRGLFMDVSGQIRFLEKPYCAGYKVQAHRGHHQFYENSRLSLTHALADGFDGVELDLVENGGFYFLHHDSKFGRAASDFAGSDTSPTRINMKKKFLSYYHRDMKTGELTDVNLPLLPEILERYHEISKPYQTLNFDLKGGMRKSELHELDYILSSQTINYEFSATDPRDLATIREINPEVYLGVITPANSDSIKQLKADLASVGAHDPLYKNNDYLNQRLEHAKQPTLKDYLRWNGRMGDDANFGYHIDIRDLDNNPSLLQKLKSQSRAKRIATYTINSQKYHLQVLQKLKKQNIQPDLVIIDDDMFGFCGQVEPVKVTKRFATSHPIQQMPADADVRLWKEQSTLFNDGLYIALDGDVKPIKTKLLAESVQSSRNNNTQNPTQPEKRMRKKEFIPVKEAGDATISDKETVIIDIETGGRK
jgi:glycerophosphoryl diester phosphodiesterase